MWHLIRAGYILCQDVFGHRDRFLNSLFSRSSFTWRIKTYFLLNLHHILHLVKLISKEKYRLMSTCTYLSAIAEIELNVKNK